MLSEIASRRIALRAGIGAALAGGLAACATSTVPGASGATNTVVMTPAQISAQAAATLAAVSSAVTIYLATNPAAATPGIVSNIAKAEAAAKAGIATIATADVSTAAATAVSVANTIASIVTVIPGLPAPVVAGALAFQVLVAALEPIINGKLPLGATRGLMAIKPGATRVLLVPNH
jgi:hypothetical protein